MNSIWNKEIYVVKPGFIGHVNYFFLSHLCRCDVYLRNSN